MNCLRRPNRPMPTGAKNEEGRPQGQPSSEHCSAEACDRLHWQHVMRSTRYLCFEGEHLIWEDAARPYAVYLVEWVLGGSGRFN